MRFIHRYHCFFEKPCLLEANTALKLLQDGVASEALEDLSLGNVQLINASIVIFQLKVLLTVSLNERDQGSFEEKASTKRVIVAYAVIDKTCKDQSSRTVAVSIRDCKSLKSHLSIIVREVFLPPLAGKSRDIN